MDKYLCRKDVFDEIEKAMRDRSHLTQKKVTDKNGHQRTVWVKPGENPVAEKGKKTEDTPEQKSSKPKHEVGSLVHLDENIAGSFKVDSIDKDGSYHVSSEDGRKYHVSENHLSAVKESDKKGKTMSDKYGERYTVDSESEDGYVHVKDARGNNKRIHNSELKDVSTEKSPTEDIDKQISDLVIQQINGKISKKDFESKMDELNKQRTEIKNSSPKEPEKKEQPKKQVSFEVQQNRKQQQKKEKEKYDYNKRMNDFYVNTGLNGGPDAVLYRQAVEKEENKQPNLRAGSRDDSIFNENDDVTFWRSGNYIDGKITQVKEDYRGNVSLQIEANGNKYWVETEDIIKHPSSAK